MRIDLTDIILILEITKKYLNTQKFCVSMCIYCVFVPEMVNLVKNYKIKI